MNIIPSIPPNVVIDTLLYGARQVTIARLGSRLTELRKDRQAKPKSIIIRNAIADLLAELALLGASLDQDGFIVTG